MQKCYFQIYFNFTEWAYLQQSDVSNYILFTQNNQNQWHSVTLAF
jgi:hypothetical protein